MKVEVWLDIIFTPRQVLPLLPFSFSDLWHGCCYSVAKSCLTLWDSIDSSMPGFLSFTISRSLLKLMSIESMMPSNHLILCDVEWPAKKKNEYLLTFWALSFLLILYGLDQDLLFMLPKSCLSVYRWWTGIWRQLWRRKEWLYFFGRQRGSTSRTVLLSLENSIVYRVSCSVLSDFVTPWTITCQDPLSMGILQAQISEWVTISSSRGSSQPRNRTRVSCLVGGLFTIWATREALENGKGWIVR